MARSQDIETQYHPKTMALAIAAPYNHTSDIQPYYEEFYNLLETNGIEPDIKEEIKLREINPITFVTPGKLELIRQKCQEENIEMVIVSEPLNSQQERNLSDYLNCDVFDRTQLILEIFEKAAHSGEGKTQVEIAMLKHAKTRLAGKGIGLAQQSGVVGLRGGPGETLKERERRQIDDKIKRAERKLKTLENVRDTQRKRRLSSGMPLICLIGYTNAGKSSLLNALTKSDVLAEDKLFATLDTSTRELFIDHEHKALLSDTVGFIQFLPPKLIDAFKSTLSELAYADLLLLVVDLSDPNWENQIKVVHEVLADLDVDKPIYYIFNKIDKVPVLEEVKDRTDKYLPQEFISTKEKPSLQVLRNNIGEWMRTYKKD